MVKVLSTIISIVTFTLCTAASFVGGTRGGSSGGSQTLDQVFDLGAVIDGAVDEGTAFTFGSPTGGWKAWHNATDHSVLKAWPDDDMVTANASGKSIIWKTSSGTTYLSANDSGVITANISGTASDLSATLTVAKGGTELTSSADDTTMVGNGSVWQAKSLPSCSNSTTSKLLYNTSTNSFSCGTDQSSGSSAFRCGLIDCTSPNLGSFTNMNIGTSTLEDTSYSGSLYIETDVNAGVQGSEITTSGNFTATAYLQMWLTTTYNNCGIGVRGTGDSHLTVFDVVSYDSGTTHLKVDHLPSFTTYNSSPFDAGAPYLTGSGIFMRIQDNGTSHIFSYSVDGIKYHTAFTESRTAYIAAPNRVFWFCNSANASHKAAGRLLHWVLE